MKTFMLISMGIVAGNVLYATATGHTAAEIFDRSYFEIVGVGYALFFQRMMPFRS